MNTPILIKAENLVKSYLSFGKLFSKITVVRAVNGITLHISRGETLGLVGESGSGKSTLGRLLLGLEKPDHGMVEFDGSILPRPTSGAWRRLRARMQMVYQDPLSALDRRLTVAEQIGEPLKIHDLGSRAERIERVAELLNAVGLTAAQGERLPGELSGGQRQRAVLARALATRPDLLVCDEPFSALDVSTQTRVMKLIADVQARTGTTILFISHDLRAIGQICDRVAVMYLGNIVEEGPTQEILRTPRHPYTKALISAIPGTNGLNPNRILLQGDPPNPACLPSGCAFHPRCPMAVQECRHEAPLLATLAGSNSRVACSVVRAEKKAAVATSVHVT